MASVEAEGQPDTASSAEKDVNATDALKGKRKVRVANATDTPKRNLVEMHKAHLERSNAQAAVAMGVLFHLEPLQGDIYKDIPTWKTYLREMFEAICFMEEACEDGDDLWFWLQEKERIELLFVKIRAAFCANGEGTKPTFAEALSRAKPTVERVEALFEEYIERVETERPAWPPRRAFPELSKLCIESVGYWKSIASMILADEAEKAYHRRCLVAVDG